MYVDLSYPSPQYDASIQQAHCCWPHHHFHLLLLPGCQQSWSKMKKMEIWGFFGIPNFQKEQSREKYFLEFQTFAFNRAIHWMISLLRVKQCTSFCFILVIFDSMLVRSELMFVFIWSLSSLINCDRFINDVAPVPA